MTILQCSLTKNSAPGVCFVVRLGIEHLSSISAATLEDVAAKVPLILLLVTPINCVCVRVSATGSEKVKEYLNVAFVAGVLKSNLFDCENDLPWMWAVDDDGDGPRSHAAQRRWGKIPNLFSRACDSVPILFQ